MIETLSSDPEHQDDTPSKVLSEEASTCIAKPPEPFDPVIDMKTK